MLTAENDPGFDWVSTPSCLQQSLGTHLQLHQFASIWPCNVFTAKFKPAKTMWTMIESNVHMLPRLHNTIPHKTQNNDTATFFTICISYYTKCRGMLAK